MAALHIQEGTAYVLFAYDVGWGIDLDDAERRVAAGGRAPSVDIESGEPVQREELKHVRPGGASLQFKPRPLRVDQRAEPIEIATTPPSPGAFRTEGRVEITLFDFGGISVVYRVPIRGPLDALLPLAAALYENVALLADSRRRAQAMADRVGAAILRPEMAELREDYVVYQISHFDDQSRAQSFPAEPPNAAATINAHRRTIAQLLRSDASALSDQEIDDALANRISFGTRDAAVIDWNAALLIDDQPEDALAVIEFTNVELLEVRVLDDRLDGILDHSYGVMQRARRGVVTRLFPGGTREERGRLAALQMDAALLFEGVNNAIKLVGDQYLARFYRLTADRFHLPDWDASILRKLDTLDSLYEKLNDEQATRRMEVLEWIIIVLIAVSIILPFVWAAK